MIEQNLLEWKSSQRRKPLLMRGARQVGKTYSVEKFGHEYFDRLAYVNLEKNLDWHRIFSGNLDVHRILAELEIVLNTKITPGKTLLFLDEIQSCPRAIMALRYFYEDSPDLHVIAAGSLLEFAFGDISFPVGRVQHVELFPVNFAEYLWAVGKEHAAEVVLASPRRVEDSIHDLLLHELRRYFFVGGMPESVAVYVKTGSIRECFAVHKEICDSFREDFSKYARRANPHCLDAVFQGVARKVGSQVKYTRLAAGYAVSTIKRAFDLLCKARVISKVSSASPAGLPLGATASSKKFKALMVDIGLWHHLCGLKVDREFALNDLLAIYRGAMAEQFVGQELMVSQESDIYYWSRQARGSQAEVDYLAVVDGSILPVEVKSSSAGRLKSMHMLLQTHPDCPGGLVFSCAPYAELPEQKLTFLPLYYAFSATRTSAQQIWGSHLDLRLRKPR